MQTAKIFKNDQSQAVRLPKEFRFDSDHVLVRRVGESAVLRSPKNSWDTLLDSLTKFSPDFMEDGHSRRFKPGKRFDEDIV